MFEHTYKLSNKLLRKPVLAILAEYERKKELHNNLENALGQAFEHLTEAEKNTITRDFYYENGTAWFIAPYATGVDIIRAYQRTEKDSLDFMIRSAERTQSEFLIKTILNLKL